MKIEATWSKPIPLKPDGSGYTLDLGNLPDEPGVYVFGRRHGAKVTPIYIGETLSIRGRVKNHLDSRPLMDAVKAAQNGSRFLLYCTVKATSREKAKKQVKIIEKSLILHAQSEGHELFNKRGAKLPTNSIQFSGNRTSESIAPRIMLIKRVLTK